jgi:hypothetical protein
LRKRGKQVIGIGVKHTASRSFVSLCDDYVFYEELVPTPELTGAEVEKLLRQAMSQLLVEGQTRVRASILKQQMGTLSRGTFEQSPFGNGSFRKFLSNYPDLVEVSQEGTTIYASYPKAAEPEINSSVPLHKKYRSGLKKQKFRVVPSAIRFVVLKDAVRVLGEHTDLNWRQLIDMLASLYVEQERVISKNMINDVLLVARQGQVVNTLKGKSLATAPIQLNLQSKSAFQEAVVRCDAAYLKEILELDEPFDLEEATLALYESLKYAAYLQTVMTKWMDK